MLPHPITFTIQLNLSADESNLAHSRPTPKSSRCAQTKNYGRLNARSLSNEHQGISAGRDPSNGTAQTERVFPISPLDESPKTPLLPR